ncbi:8259_t:CDS:2, partial [Funneliformis geosporum]
NQLNSLNNKLVSQITCERKSHATLNAKQLKEIESLRSMELENELEKVTQNSSFKNGLIFCLRSRVRNLEDELDQIISQSHQSINDSKIGSAEADTVSSSNDYALAPLAKRGEAVEESDKSKVKDEIEPQRDHLHVDQKSKEKHD